MLTAAITGSSSNTLTTTAINPASATVTYSAIDPYGGYISRSVTIMGQKSVTLSVAENSGAGTAVGDPVTGTPYGNAKLSYKLTGDAATPFVIDAATGQITVKTDGKLDYEDTNSYTGQVEYTVEGQAAVVSITINLTDLKAGKPGTPTLARTPSSVKMNPALDVTWTAAPANGAAITGYEVRYRIKVAEGETENKWTPHIYDDGSDGGASVLPADTTTANLPDLDAGATYEVQVRALAGVKDEGEWSDIGEGTANRSPYLAGQALQNRQIARGSKINETFGTGYSWTPMATLCLRAFQNIPA